MRNEAENSYKLMEVDYIFEKLTPPDKVKERKKNIDYKDWA